MVYVFIMDCLSVKFIKRDITEYYSLLIFNILHMSGYQYFELEVNFNILLIQEPFIGTNTSSISTLCGSLSSRGVRVHMVGFV